MDALLEKAAQSIAEAAGWKKPHAAADGSFSFSLEGNLDFTMLSPDGKTGILLAQLGEAPEVQSPQEGADLERIASLAAGVLRSRNSVLSISDQNILELHRSFSLRESQGPQMLGIARDFLNDFAWWKKQLEKRGQPSRFSGTGMVFDFPINWFQG